MTITLFFSWPGTSWGNSSCNEQSEVYFPAQVKRNVDIAGIQATLRNLGYYYAPVNGTYDQVTVQAVKSFQSSEKLPVTGIFDEKTRYKLVSYYDGPQQKNNIKPKGKVSISINLDQRIMFILDDGKVFSVYPVAVGKNHASPVGEWKVLDKRYQPGGPFGSRWMGLSCKWAPYGIHGTNQPWSIGGAHSLGCIRMQNHDVAEIFDWIKIGTPVNIVGTPYSPFYEERLQVGLGSRGSEVVLVQQKLREKGYFKGTVDGYFEEDTTKALKKFQKEHGFKETGVVDMDIYAALGL